MICKILSKRTPRIIRRFTEVENNKGTVRDAFAWSAMNLKPIDVSSKDFKGTYANNEHLYVDKTAAIFRYLSTGDKYTFITRPRRFGKSLMLDIIRLLYSDPKAKDLFKYTWLGSRGDEVWDHFKTRPVIHMEMPPLELPIKHFKDNLKSLVSKETKIPIDPKVSENMFFQNAIKETYAKYNKKCVVLIDEYDMPVMSTITANKGIGVLKDVLKVMHDFYLPLKGCDNYIHKCIVTGIAKFAKDSLFSGKYNKNKLYSIE